MEKPPLPIKTKIAAWWMIVVGCLEVLISLSEWPFSIFLWIIEPVFQGLLVIIPGFLLLKRKKVGWWLAIIILLILLPSILLLNVIQLAFFQCFYFLCVKFFPFSIIGIVIRVIFCIFIFYIPLILLLDRKNFWKIAT